MNQISIIKHISHWLHEKFGISRRIYLDHASLTPIDSEVINVVNKYSRYDFVNASSWYKEGIASKNALQDARKSTADFLHAHQDEIIFTSGGTESNNIAILGTVNSARQRGIEYGDMHVIASEIEHSSVLECLEHLKTLDVAVDLLKVDSRGLVDPKELKEKIRPTTVIVSVMTVNNEIGTIEPIRELAKIIRHFRKTKVENRPVCNVIHDAHIFDISQDSKYPLFHTDSAQGALYLDLNVEQLGIDLLTLDGSKTYGPRGVGTLFIRKKLLSNSLVSPIIFGGGQEEGIRSGTENIAGITGFARSLQLAQKYRESERVRLNELRSVFMMGLKSMHKDIVINTPIEDSSPHILNISIPGIDNEFFVMQLDAKGIACSTKSSCLRDVDESYVLRAVGADSNTSIRFSFGRGTTKKEIQRVIGEISKILG